MSAYFSVDIACDRENLYGNLVCDFCKTLEHIGFQFLSGFCGFEKESLERIIAWNQKKLESNFVLGYSEHYFHDYRQICFAYEGFSEVRLFMLNDRKKNEFSFHIIIPEHDFIAWKEGKRQYHDQKLQEILKLMREIWMLPFVGTIQTSLELSAGSVSMDEIRNGAIPSIEPAAIIPEDLLHCEFDDGVIIAKMARKGIFIIGLGGGF